MVRLAQLETVNRLAEALRDLRGLLTLAERAEPRSFQMLIETAGDTSVKLSNEGATSAHERGFAVSDEYLADLKKRTLQELRARVRAVVAELGALGVEADES